MELIPVESRENAADLLYQLLWERDGEGVNISHGATPPFETHKAFVANHPYQGWYLIEDDGVVVGSIYLTQPPEPSVAGNEIGIFIFKAHQRKGYAREAIRMLMDKHGPRTYLANINPANEKSLALFEAEGFALCQYTLRKVVE